MVLKLPLEFLKVKAKLCQNCLNLFNLIQKFMKQIWHLLCSSNHMDGKFVELELFTHIFSVVHVFKIII
jgi:hypothetical protein